MRASNAFTYPGGTVSAGDCMFKYVAGVYKQDDLYLYVNRGIGNWFPMRLGAPPEVYAPWALATDQH